MLMTLGLVVVLPVGFAYGFVFLANTVGISLLRFATDRPWTGRFYVEWYVIVGAVGVGFLAQYFLGSRRAMRSVDAEVVEDDQYPELQATVARLSQTVDVPQPDLAVAESDVPNAFTVGRRPSKATIVVTSELVETLEADELEGVLAHELAHVRNRDVSVMTFSYFLPSFTYFVAMGAYFVLGGVFKLLGGFRHADDEGAGGLAIALVVVSVSAVCTLLLSALFWVMSFLVFRILSRYREYVADRAGAVITGDPAALASALETLDGEMSEVPDEDLRAADGGIEALYVAPIDTYQFGPERDLISSDVFPATHPPVGERIDRLRDLQREVEQA
jgi:heat shock protein HtpX